MSKTKTTLITLGVAAAASASVYGVKKLIDKKKEKDSKKMFTVDTEKSDNTVSE